MLFHHLFVFGSTITVKLNGDSTDMINTLGTSLYDKVQMMYGSCTELNSLQEIVDCVVDNVDPNVLTDMDIDLLTTLVNQHITEKPSQCSIVDLKKRTLPKWLNQENIAAGFFVVPGAFCTGAGVYYYMRDLAYPEVRIALILSGLLLIGTGIVIKLRCYRKRQCVDIPIELPMTTKV